LQTGTDLEPDTLEIHRYRLNLGQQILICDKFKFIKFKNLIHVIWFIQNQRQRRASSTTLVKEKPDGLHLFFVLKKIRNLLLRCLCNIQHGNLPDI